MKKILLIFVFLASFVLGEDFGDFLTSPKKAEITIQQMIDDEGDFKKASEFGIKALKVYSDNVFLLAYTGKAYYNIGNLEDAKKYFMQALDLDPTNEVASQFIKLIEEQELAKENKAVTGSLAYINDKGLDYLLIFLAFLGGEIIARRYSHCQAKKSLHLTKVYVWNKTTSPNIFQKIFYIVVKAIKNPFCSFLSLLVTLTTTVAITIVIVWFELSIYPFLIGINELRLIGIEEIGIHGIKILLGLILVFLVINSMNAIKELGVSSAKIADIVQNLALENNFEILRECCCAIYNNNLDSKILMQCANNEAKEVLEKMFTIIKESKNEMD
jgi:hypothetical protein